MYALKLRETEEPLSTLAVLQSLRQLQDSWKKLTFKDVFTVPGSDREYQLTDSMFGYVLDGGAGFPSLSFHFLRADNPVPAGKLIENTGVDLHDFAFDVVQDLLVYVVSPA